MTEEQLKENGYPMPHPERPGRAVLFTAEEKKTIDCKLCWLLRSAGCARYVTAAGARPACRWSLCVERFSVAARSVFCCCDGSPWPRAVSGGQQRGCRQPLPFETMRVTKTLFRPLWRVGCEAG